MCRTGCIIRGQRRMLDALRMELAEYFNNNFQLVFENFTHEYNISFLERNVLQVLGHRRKSLHHRGKSEKKIRGRNWSRSHGGVLLTNLLLVCSICFIIEPRTSCPYMSLPMVIWVLPHQSSIKTGNLWRHFLDQNSLFPDDSMLCHIDIN